MSLHKGPIVVRFHGGFLAGRVSRSGEKVLGEIDEIWNADAIYFATRGQVGAAMIGVSEDELQASKERSSINTKTFRMDHAYRVTRLTLEKGVMTIDVQYEFIG
jgi:hypothetical protein